jgi:hypothetical protein
VLGNVGQRAKTARRRFFCGPLSDQGWSGLRHSIRTAGGSEPLNSLRLHTSSRDGTRGTANAEEAAISPILSVAAAATELAALRCIAIHITDVYPHRPAASISPLVGLESHSGKAEVSGNHCAAPCGTSETAHPEQGRHEQGSVPARCRCDLRGGPCSDTSAIAGYHAQREAELSACTSVDGHDDTQCSGFDRIAAWM